MSYEPKKRARDAAHKLHRAMSRVRVNFVRNTAINNFARLAEEHGVIHSEAEKVEIKGGDMDEEVVQPKPKRKGRGKAKPLTREERLTRMLKKIGKVVDAQLEKLDSQQWKDARASDLLAFVVLQKDLVNELHRHDEVEKPQQAGLDTWLATFSKKDEP